MTQPDGLSPIVVGIDGSNAAVAAALWAADEAVAREVPLRLVHAADVADIHPNIDFRVQITEAERLFRTVEAAVAATGKAVKVETAVVGAGPRQGLLIESRNAEMMCVGSIGVGRSGDTLGSTAAAVANAAFCPVAIIRSDVARLATTGGWIAVSVDNSPESDHIIGNGFAEARLRDAPLLALWTGVAGSGDCPLDHRLAAWREGYPEVQVRTRPAPNGVAEYFSRSTVPVQLAVIGCGQVAPLMRFLPTAAISIVELCSLLVVRH
ncbi:universal stress protein [Mycobacterium sp.]|uniref:universal stress protein n=1 Tax=Mycobacterium sp. TaxID=1785 RepID=UPI002CCF3EDE|nr:universal stress protein [Mycobacterium sp.]HTQ15806.1 universal stress protein [Mycobacterium sp.]